MDYLIRVVRVDEWRRLKELRLADPLAAVAFNQTWEKTSVLGMRGCGRWRWWW